MASSSCETYEAFRHWTYCLYGDRLRGVMGKDGVSYVVGCRGNAGIGVCGNPAVGCVFVVR